ncbi:TniQ family protein [Algirhabdus cladophorae]|uniref:TniQ family protein n=1 Tax=Algirhabdus cladophorae TaxID=3377108 RepID=UPI003B84A1CC
MMRLRLSVTPFEGETTNSIITRIADRNGASFAQDFCADMGERWRDITGGDDIAIEAFADLTGIPHEKLGRYAVREIGHRTYDLNGQFLSHKTVDRGSLKVCPSCLVEDFELGGARHRYCRAEWLLTSYQVCHRHRKPMLPLPKAEFPRSPYDFYQRIKDCWRAIQRAAETHKDFSGDVAWETYLASRVRGRKSSVWCDRFDLDLLCHIVVNLGTVIRFGSARNPSDLRSDEMPRAASLAFHAVRDGHKSLVSAFRSVRDASNSPKPGFQADFGAYARWLYRVDYRSPRYAELLDLTARFAFENYPFGKGDVLFGRTCQERQIHSITSAAKQHGLKHPRMTILAVGLGLGSKDRHERIEFSAKKYDPVLNEFARCLRPKLAAAELGIRVEALQRLAKVGILKPRFDMPSMVPVYHPSDLEMFRSGVLKQATVVDKIPTDMIPLFKLCNHAKCHFEEAIDLVRSGSLSSFCRLHSSSRIHDCFADLEDLRDQFQGPKHQGYTKQDVKRLLRVNDPTVTLLVRKSMLRARMVRHHRSRRPMALIGSDAMSEFLSSHATLGMMAYAARTQAKHVATKLDKAGFEPLPLGERFSKIYRRTPELENLFHPGGIA